MKRVGFIVLAVVTAALAIAGYFFFNRAQDALQAPFVDTTLLANMPEKDASRIDTSHVAAGLIPPTNKWYSGLALQKIPKTVFSSPLSFTAQETSFSFSLPQVTATKNTIFGLPSEAVTVAIAGATHYQVSRYDELSVDLTYSSDKSKLATVTLVAGSPYIYVQALTGVTATVTSGSAVTTLSHNRRVFEVTHGNYVAAGFEGARVLGDKIELIKNSLLTLYGLPTSVKDDPLQPTAANRITSAAVTYAKAANDYKTTLTLKTANNQPTVYGLLPHQAQPAKELFSYDTLYGAQRMYQGAAFSFTTPSVPVTDSLELGALSPSNKELLVTTLRRDVNATEIKAEDSYFGGKEMYRSAQLLQLARQLGEDTIADSIQQKLHHELTTWLSPMPQRSKKYFYYDTKMHSVVGETVAFGSEELNDHHFHYGYFIYAASILAKYDSDFEQQYKTTVDLIVADIANYRAGEQLPLRRSFDPYFGHSWASGSAPFNDGNNQESSSEAINAWVATSLWASQTKNTELEQEAQWMLSGETAATTKYWMNFNPQEAPYSNGYDHSLVSLNWGGKRDYATFFSADPAAMLGILLIPLNPTMIYQSQYSDRIATQVKEAMPQGEYNTQFGDYILMYSALSSKENVLSKAQALDDTIIDGANSRSYMYAWIMSRASR